MQPKRSKYDTSPLDEKVGDRARDAFASHAGAETEQLAGATREISSQPNQTSRTQAEAPTRLITDKVTSYPSVFVPPQRPPLAQYEAPGASQIYQPPPVAPPSVYQPPARPAAAGPGRNSVAGLGIPERWAVLLPYVPFYLAIVIAIVELILVPRTETRTRFHASQALALQIIITAVSTLLTFIGLFTERFSGAGLFSMATFVFLIIAMVRVWKGKPFVVTPLDDARKWLDEKIKPRK